MEDSDIIKKYKDFMPDISFKKLLGQIIISGSIKGTFFRKSRPFELQIFYTPLRGKIVQIFPIDVELDDPKLNIDFKIGDHIELAREWVEKNGHKITFERNRFQI